MDSVIPNSRVLLASLQIGYPLGTLIRDSLLLLVTNALSACSLAVPDGFRPEIIDTKEPSHGDFACNVAMVLSKQLGMNPRDLAQGLVEALTPELAKLDSSVEIAGPGFLNFRLSPSVFTGFVGDVLSNGIEYCQVRALQPQRINIEFVSVNPNGPITVGSGRGAAFGSVLARILERCGHTVHREFYINDGVNSEQMRLFAESVKAIANGELVPENGYRGDYVEAVAKVILEQSPDCAGQETAWFQAQAQRQMLKAQKADLAAFGVEFDTWFSEQSLHDRGAVQKSLALLHESGAADSNPRRVELKLGKKGEVQEAGIAEEEPGADWLRSTKFGDDMDRVLKRSNGRLTYIASDIAYHQDKFTRPANATHLITVLGPDHHGYIGRLHAVLAALLKGSVAPQADNTPLADWEQVVFESVPDRNACRSALAEARAKLDVLIFQIVRFMKDGQPAPMRKRDGNIFALIDLIDDIGRAMAPGAPQGEQRRIGSDVSRFFYLMRSHETHMDFDIDLALKQSDENPVYYAQYAHARIASVQKKAQEAGFSAADANPNSSAGTDLSLLVDPREMLLIKKVLDLPNEIARAGEDYGVHRLTTYVVELARSFHHFYDGCRVVQTDVPELSKARLALCAMARIGFLAAFDVLGISAPDQMTRDREDGQ